MYVFSVLQNYRVVSFCVFMPQFLNFFQIVLPSVYIQEFSTANLIKINFFFFSQLF